MNFSKTAAALVAAVLLSGCATITQGTGQTIAINTEPEGANCKLERAGIAIGFVRSSPGPVTIEKSKNDVLVTCNKEGFLEEQQPLAAGFAGMTLGNLLLGGIIGVAIDAGSGAINKYPESVTLFLDPTEFASLEARDTYYDAAVMRVNDQADETAATVQEKCENDDSNCKKPLAEVEKERELQLVELEGRRQAAAITAAS